MMPDREKVIRAIEGCINFDDYCNDCVYDGCIYVHGSCEKDLLADALAMLKEQQQQIWELQDQVEYLTDKRKEKETKLICNLLGGQPYEVYCRECRTRLCILGKGETMNDVKSIFSYCPHCGKRVSE